MKHVEIHFHYLIKLVQDNIVTLVYCKKDDQLVDICTKPLQEVKFIKFHSLLRLQEAAIMVACTNVISPLEYPECCDNGGVLEPHVLLVHHITGSSRDN